MSPDSDLVSWLAWQADFTNHRASSTPYDSRQTHAPSQNNPPTTFRPYSRTDAALVGRPSNEFPHRASAMSNMSEGENMDDEEMGSGSPAKVTPESGKVVGSRRPHRKSRRGCLQCKQRRIKVRESHLTTSSLADYLLLTSPLSCDVTSCDHAACFNLPVLLYHCAMDLFFAELEYTILSVCHLFLGF